MDGPKGYVWWKDGWLRTSIISSFIFISGIAVGAGIQLRTPERNPDYSFKSDFFEMTWTFRRPRVGGVGNQDMERLTLRSFSLNFATATMVSKDSVANREMLLRLVVLLDIAFRRNIIQADSSLRLESQGDTARNGFRSSGLY